MLVYACLTQDHNLWLVLLAAIMCTVGSVIVTKLISRTLMENGPVRFHWIFLSALTGGAVVWSTHFIAMLGYDPGVPRSFDATLTIVSALIAFAGIGFGVALAGLRNRLAAAVCGGGSIGLAVAAMHYTGMFAFRVDGIVEWLPGYLAASIASGVVLGIGSIHLLRARAPMWQPTALLILSIVLLHFIGMAAFSVTPVAGVSAGADTEAFSAMASAIAMVALLIAAAGISTHLIENRTRAASEVRLEHIAHHDALTGLANRHMFTERLKTLCRTGKDEDPDPFAILMVDLDRFKPVNDTLGPPVGDQLLNKVAQRLIHAVRDGDLVARIGGDEFAVVARGVADHETATEIAGRIVEILNRPFVLEGNVAEIGGSCGIVLAPRDGRDADTLMQNVDIALYTAKREGRQRFRMFEPRLTDEMQRRRYLEADLRRACMREDFAVVYQPVIDTGTGGFIGAEALVRWHCPNRGEISPAEFIPIAEELGLVSRIGSLVLHRACMDAAAWPEDQIIAVNISPVQLMDPRLPQVVSQALEESGLPAKRLELEITETALLNNDDIALRNLQRCKELGLTISLDDFGTGYSSLSYLHRFPISRIKIDRSFVQKLSDDAGSVSIVRAITQLGESLGMKITAEGIETDEQLASIASYGCSNVQGFLISQPIDAHSIGALFAGPESAVA